MSLQDSSRWGEIREAFDAAAELDDLACERLLNQLDLEDEELAREVRSLLAAFRDEPDFLERPVSIPRMLGPAPGVRVGPFRLDRTLGEGGMGTVFLGHRVDGSFDQTVAVKFVRAGISGERLRNRFEAERSILARLNHPNIARLYDGGVTDGGLPYLVMEYVEGRPITLHCHDVQSSVQERIELLQAVCAAVQYAHQNLVVHRDLKPSNILVTAEGTVKLLDFGVGKILEAPDDVGGNSIGPATLTFALTPSYSAPEQLRGEPVSTSADVYALGTIAYELFAGRLPFDLDGLDLAQAERRVREQLPEPPSSALKALHDGGGPAPTGVVNPDLDTIILKALRKDPAERYASAFAMAGDLSRYQAGRPVTAREPTLSYRAAKFVLRNKVRVAASATVSLLFATAAAGTIWQARLATANATQARQALLQAQEAAERTQRVNDFLQRILQTPNPSWYVENELKGPDVTVLEALVEAASRIEIDLADDPEIQADIHHTLGDTYRALGEHEAMLPHFERALEIRSAHFEPPHPKIAESLFYMAAARALFNDMVASDTLIRAAIDMQRSRDEGNNLPYMLDHLSSSLQHEGRFAEATAVQREALGAAEERLGPDHPTTVFLKSDLAYLLVAAGRREDGLRLANAVGTEATSPAARARVAAAIAMAGDTKVGEALLRGLDDTVARTPAGFALERDVLIPEGRLEEARSRLQATLSELASGQADLPLRSGLQALGLSARVARLQGRSRDAEHDLATMESGLADVEAQGQLAFYWAENRLARSERAALELQRGEFQVAERFLMENLRDSDEGLGAKTHRDETMAQLAALSESQGRDF